MNISKTNSFYGYNFIIILDSSYIKLFVLINDSSIKSFKSIISSILKSIILVLLWNENIKISPNLTNLITIFTFKIFLLIYL